MTDVGWEREDDLPLFNFGPPLVEPLYQPWTDGHKWFPFTIQPCPPTGPSLTETPMTPNTYQYPHTEGLTLSSYLRSTGVVLLPTEIAVLGRRVANLFREKRKVFPPRRHRRYIYFDEDWPIIQEALFTYKYPELLGVMDK